MPGPKSGWPGAAGYGSIRRRRSRPGAPAACSACVHAAGVIATAMEAVNPQFWLNLRATWEAVNNGWNQWVLNYNQSTQLDLLKDIGFDSPSWEDLGYVLIALIVLASLLGAAWTLWERHRHDPWLRLLERAAPPTACSRLARGPGQPAAHAWHRLVRTALGRCRSAYAGAHRAGCWHWKPCGMPAPAATTSPRLADLRREFSQLPWPDDACTLPLLPARLPAVPVPALPADAAKPSSKRKVGGARPTASALYATRDDAMRLADEIAERRGLDRDWVRQAIGQSRHLPQVARWVLPPAPADTPRTGVSTAAASSTRCASGPASRSGRPTRPTLARAEQTFGVPAEIIVGIIGVETIYGRNTGNFRVMDALATLSFDFPDAHPRAAERQRLLPGRTRAAAVAGAARADRSAAATRAVTPAPWACRSSCPRAGSGMRSTSMPMAASTCSTAPSDVIGSVANYFEAFGWKNGMPTHYPVHFDKVGARPGHAAGTRHPAHFQRAELQRQGRDARRRRPAARRPAGPGRAAQRRCSASRTSPAQRTSTSSRATTGAATTPWR